MRNLKAVLSLVAVGICAPTPGRAECPPWRLAPADAPEGARYGSYVAIDEPWAVLVANNDSSQPALAPVVFHWTGLAWEEYGALDVGCDSGWPSGTVASSIHGDRIAVSTMCREVRIFRFDGSQWLHEGTLTGDGLPPSSFGASVCIRGDRCIVGDTDMGNGPGRAFIFRYLAGGWSFEAELTADNGQVEDDFGRSVSIDGDSAVVGAPNARSHNCACQAGAVYVYHRVGHSWSQTAILHAPVEDDWSLFGSLVAIRESVLVSAAIGQNAVYRFRHLGDTWGLDDSVGGGSNFGTAISLTGDVCVIGSPSEAALWVWGPELLETLSVPNGMPGDLLGTGVGIGEEFAIAGAPGQLGTISTGGAAWVFPVLTADAPDCNSNLVHDLTDICNGTSRDCNASGVPDECEMVVVSTNPPSGAIDARQPSSIDGSMAFGWDYFDVVFSSSAVELHPADFVVEEQGAVGTPIDVLIVLPLGDNTYRLLLSSPIRPNRWTTVRNDCIGEVIRLGFLPGDVNADRLSRPLDILSLIDALNGVGVARPIWSTDIDRSGLATPADILREIDLLNGAGAFDVFNGATLP